MPIPTSTVEEVQAEALKLVGRYARRAATTQAELERIMRVASEAGCSLREIAEQANVSHMTVKRVIEA